MSALAPLSPAHDPSRLNGFRPSDREHASFISATAWLPGEAPRPISLDEAATNDGVTCLVVKVGADPGAVLAALRPICGHDLTYDMVDDLLSVDPLPRVQDYGEGGTIRKVSAFGATAEARPSDFASTGEAGRLVFDLVEFLANDHWLILCCHETESFAGANTFTRGTAMDADSLLDAAARQWRAGGFETPGDLGILMLHELTRTYSSARRALLSWLEYWELRFYRSGESNRETLVNLRGLVSEFRARLNGLNCPRDEAANAWFQNLRACEIAERADRNIDKAGDALVALADMLRTSFELLQSQATAEHLRLQQVQADHTEKLQEKIEKITSLFLVPSLIAAFFGANTALPGGNGTHAWANFELMVLSMVVGAVAVYFGLGWIREREKGNLAREAAQ